MTNQEKKEALQQYLSAGREEERLEREIQRWRSRAEKMTAGYSRASGGTGDDRSLEQTVARIDELTRQLTCQREELVSLRRSIGAAIDAVPEARLRELLRLRYIDGMSFEQIAVKMNYCWRQVLRLHGRALSAVVIECHT